MTANRIGYDSTDPGDCPGDGDIYLGYIDGTYSGNHAVQAKLHPKKAVWSIGRFPASRAQWYDVEAGLLTPAEGAALAKGNIERGEFAGLYCNLSSWPTVKAAVHAEGITGKVSYWIAWEHGGDDTIPAGAVGRQYLLSPGLSPGHFDKSVFIDYIEGLDPAPKPKPDPHPVHGTEFAKDMGEAVDLATRRFKLRKEHGSALDAKATKATHELIAAATSALGVKP